MSEYLASPRPAASETFFFPCTKHAHFSRENFTFTTCSLLMTTGKIHKFIYNIFMQIPVSVPILILLTFYLSSTLKLCLNPYSLVLFHFHSILLSLLILLKNIFKYYLIFNLHYLIIYMKKFNKRFVCKTQNVETVSRKQ